MRYDFDTPVDRRGTDSYKWDVKDGELPMWVADMDFKTAPEITAAIQKRAAHGVYGYSIVPDEWYNALIGWWQKRHAFKLKREWLIFCTGVVPAISSAVRKLTTPAERVVLLSPVYNIFYNSIVNNGRRVLECPLAYKDGVYEIDWAAFERALSDPQTTMLIFCNPHNPVGKIWDRVTLIRVGELCAKHHVTVLSDEIHCDLTDPGREYVPFASASGLCESISVTCVAPTKCFNMAGLQTAAVVAPDEALRNRMNRALNTDEIAEPGTFAVTAAVAAFNEGGQWLDELRAYLYENKLRVREFIDLELPRVRLVPSEATYLLWLDCMEFARHRARELAHFIRESTGLYLSDGAQYGTGGDSFLRLNIACPRQVLEDGLCRLKSGILNFT
ncbi:MAG: pyridoxal phosphate-dependent aminotransferase [Butyrivibrio sp.]|nr:pyridoxal phosphate-dependent aminotransferase [Butyrivibrio sp.]